MTSGDRMAVAIGYGRVRMALEVGLWRVDGDQPVRVKPSGVPLESQLETMIEADPEILGTPLLLIGRQVPTDYGKFIDLLAIDDAGALHVLELKRNTTPREVVAQLLDYGSWVQQLTQDAVRDIYAKYRPGRELEQAWTDAFDASIPDEINTAHRLTVVAADIDPATERIVSYLSAYGVPVNVVSFRYFRDDARAYLARTWLLDEATTKPASAKRSSSSELWNEHDWYVSFGEYPDGRNWDDAMKYGFVSAGGGDWFSRTVRALPMDARVFTCIPKSGYVGVGTVIGPAAPFAEAVVTVDGKPTPLASLPLLGGYTHPSDDARQDLAEYVVPVAWISTRTRTDSIWESGMFANQNSACKLRNKFTLDRLYRAFKLESE